MNRERWLAISPYLDQALELRADEVEGWLRKLESTQPLIAADVRHLLRLHLSLENGELIPPMNLR